MERTDDSLYFEVNRDLTVELATAAKAKGIKHFIFLSTIKVFGLDSSEKLVRGDLAPLSFNLAPNEDSYGQSKLAAEIALKELEDENFKISIIRPPLIYGPGAKGNLHKLMQAINGNTHLPLGGIHNRRSMLYVDNLIALIDLIIEKQLTITITPADQPALSTTELVRHLAATINPAKRILTIPVFLRSLVKLLKPAFYHRLFGSLEVAPHPELEKLGYQQPYSVEEGLKEMAEDFMNQR